MKSRIILFANIFFLFQSMVGEEVERDSLFVVLDRKDITDSSRSTTLYNLAYYFSKKEPDSSRLFGKKSLELAMQIGHRKNIALSYTVIGLSYFNQGEYARAMENYNVAQQLFEKSGDSTGMGNIYNNIANVYRKTGNVKRAIHFYFRSITIKENLKDRKGLAGAYNNLGNLYNDQRQPDKSLEYHLKSLKIKEELGDEKGLAASYNNIGGIFYEQGLFDKALDYHFKSLAIKEKLKDKKGMGSSLGNLGMTYTRMGNYTEAMVFLLRSLEIKQKINDRGGMVHSWINIGEIHFMKGDFTRAEENFQLAYMEAKLIGERTAELLISMWLGRTKEERGDIKGALDFYKRYAFLKDTLLNEENNQRVAELNSRYETEKKMSQIKELEQSKSIGDLTIEKNKAEIRLQRIFLITAGVVLVLICWMAFQFYKSRNKQKEANSTIQVQKEALEEKNRDIIDSINYARGIQLALLPNREVMHSVFPEHLVMYRPRDIVSGDFYWTTKQGNYSFIAVADCTGHGVPGGFMSMLGISFLDEIVNEKRILEPADILDLLRVKVIFALKQVENVSNRDGMDIALLRVDMETNEGVSAGAMNSVVVCSSSGLEEYQGDKQPVGFYHESQIQFTQKSFRIRKGSMVYLITDGFADQFGGPKGKKFKYRKLESLLKEIYHKDIDNQLVDLENGFDTWKSNYEQVDDVTVLGIKF